MSNNREISAFTFFLTLFLVLFLVVAMVLDLSRLNANKPNFAFMSFWFLALVIVILIHCYRSIKRSFSSFIEELSEQLGKRRRAEGKRHHVKFFAFFSNIKNFFKSYMPDFFRNCTALQKISLYMSGAAIVMLAMASLGWDAAFYTMLRWIVCLAFAGHLIGEFSAGLKFVLIIGAIVYNPLAPIHLGDRQLWFLLNLLSFFLIVACQVLSIKEIRKKLKETEDNGTSQKR